MQGKHGKQKDLKCALFKFIVADRAIPVNVRIVKLLLLPPRFSMLHPLPFRSNN